HVGPPVVVAEGTRVVAAWERYDGKNTIAQTATRNPQTGRWLLPATSLPPQGRNALSPRLAIDPQGDVGIVWASLTANGATSPSSYRVVSRSFRPDSDLEAPLPGTAAPDVVLDRSGNAVAVWAATSGGAWTVHSAFRSAATGKWGKVVDVSGS